MLELFIYMQKISDNELKELVIYTTLIFLIAPAFVLAYIFVYNRRKKRHIEEKALMQLTFDAEITKTQLEVQEQTMQTIGADLHDNIGQLLSLTSLTLNSIELENSKKARQKIDAAINLTVRSIKEMRLLGKLLQGDQLVGMGLSEAIKYEVNWIEKSGSYKVNYTDDGEMPAASSPDKDLILFRILQEVLNNIIKHAKATIITIKLEYRDSVLRLQVTDNGIGFNQADLSPGQSGMGLQNIQKRAGIIGGEATITSNPDEGTTITIFTPYP
jgi:two-component system NarL family sensor kinase